MQAAGADADKLASDTAHPDPVTANDTTPVPEPPAAVNPRSVPTVPDLTAFDTTNGTWAAPANVNTFATEVAAA